MLLATSVSNPNHSMMKFPSFTLFISRFIKLVLTERLSFLNGLAASFDQAFCWYIYSSFSSGMLGWPLYSSLLLRGHHVLVLLLCGCFAVYSARVSSSMIWVSAISPAKSRSDSELHWMDFWAGPQRLFLYLHDIAYITMTVWFLWCLDAPGRTPKVGLFFCYQSDSAGLLSFPSSGTLLWVLSSVAGTSSSTARTQLL